MKKIILQLIILNLTSNVILSMEHRPGESKTEVTPEFSQYSELDPELQLHTVEQGIEARLNSNPNPIDAIVEAFKYLNNITSVNKFLYSKKSDFQKKLKQWAKEKFAPKYKDLSENELNQKLGEEMIALSKSITPNRTQTVAEQILEKINKNESPEYDKIIKMIIAGASPNFEIKKSLIKKMMLNFSPLILNAAIDFGDIDLIRLLLLYGANPNIEDNLPGIYGSRTAMFELALSSSDTETLDKILELLLKKGAKLDQVHEGTGLDLTAFAIRNRKPNALDALLNNGAKVSEEEILRAKEYEYEDIIDILRRHGYSV